MRHLLFLTLWRTKSWARADRSWLVWADRGDGVYRITPLGLLNSVLVRMGYQLQLEPL